jgi:hypothetical protein
MEFNSTEPALGWTLCSKPSCKREKNSDPNVEAQQTEPGNGGQPGSSGFLVGDAWFCSADCLHWSITQEISDLFKRWKDKTKIARPKIGTILRAKGWITNQQLERALEVQRMSGERLGTILVKIGALDEITLLKALSHHYRVGWVNEIKATLNSTALKILPRTLCESFHLLAMDYQAGRRLVVAADSRLSEELISAVHRIMGCTVQPFLAPEGELTELIKENLDACGSDSSDFVVEDHNTFQVMAQKFVENWNSLGADTARLAVVRDSLWVRYLNSEHQHDHFIFLGQNPEQSN